MSGVVFKIGSAIFSLVGDGKATLSRRATRRERANAALIRHRQRDFGHAPMGAELSQWLAWQQWQLEREAEIIRYRDGNTRKDKR